MNSPDIEKIRGQLKCYNKIRLPYDDYTKAAVLILLLIKNNDIHIIFTNRTFDVKQHKGQNSFPGGVFEELDQELINTALRETEEETGILINNVEILGELDDDITITNFHITPFVGLVKVYRNFKPEPKEIEEIFLVPVSYLLDSKNIDVMALSDTENREVYFFWYHGRCIWGATARILKNFLEVIF